MRREALHPLSDIHIYRSFFRENALLSDTVKAYVLIVALISSSLPTIHPEFPGRNDISRDVTGASASLSTAPTNDVVSRRSPAKLFDRIVKPKKKRTGKTKSIEKPKRDILARCRAAGSPRIEEPPVGAVDSFRLFTPTAPKSRALPSINGEYFAMVLALLPNPRSPPPFQYAG